MKKYTERLNIYQENTKKYQGFITAYMFLFLYWGRNIPIYIMF